MKAIDQIVSKHPFICGLLLGVLFAHFDGHLYTLEIAKDGIDFVKEEFL